jgi:glycosyltransferase involved in cell wall biosynthesis
MMPASTVSPTLGSVTEADESLRVLMLTKEWPTADKPGRAPYIEQQFRYLTAAGAKVDFFTFAGDKNPVNYLKAWWSVQRRLRARRYDVVHAQFGQTGILVAPKRLPLVVTYRGSDLEGMVGRDGRYTLTGRVLRGISRWVASQADEICLVSESLSRQLPPGTPFHVIPSGLNLEAFRPIDRQEARRHIGDPGEGLRVLFGGEPAVTRKRFPLAQQAVELLSARLPARLMVADRVPHSEMPWHMNASDVLLLTSMHEGSPNVVKEALACNVPVVSVDVGDVRMRIGALDGCRVCADDRPETIAKALEEVLTRRAPFSGRETVTGLDERVLVQRMIGIYRSAISRHRAPT